MSSLGGILIAVLALVSGVIVTTVIRGEWSWWGRGMASALLRLAIAFVPYGQRLVRQREWQAEIDYVRSEFRVPGVILALRFLIAGMRLRVAAALTFLAMAKARTAAEPASIALGIVVLLGGNIYASLTPERQWVTTTERLVTAVCFSVLMVPSLVHYRVLRAGYDGEPSYIANLVASLVFGSRVWCAMATVIVVIVGSGLVLGSWFASHLSGPLGMSLASLSWTTSGVFVVGSVTCGLFVARTRRIGSGWR